jgi:hypothetical protein
VRAGVLAQQLVDLNSAQEDDRGRVEAHGEDEEDGQLVARELEVREAAGVYAEAPTVAFSPACR